MAFKPNYSQHRAERNRLKQARRDEKREQKRERAAQRKAPGTGDDAAPSEGQGDEAPQPGSPPAPESR